MKQTKRAARTIAESAQLERREDIKTMTPAERRRYVREAIANGQSRKAAATIEKNAFVPKQKSKDFSRLDAALSRAPIDFRFESEVTAVGAAVGTAVGAGTAVAVERVGADGECRIA